MINPTEVQRKQWDEHGYVLIDHALQGEELRRLQAAFDDWAEQGKPQWIDRLARRGKPAGDGWTPGSGCRGSSFTDGACAHENHGSS